MIFFFLILIVGYVFFIDSRERRREREREVGGERERNINMSEKLIFKGINNIRKMI